MPEWRPLEHAVFLALATAVIVLAFLFCFRSARVIWPDEIGLHNPVYTYATTGAMTYPMHQPLGTKMYIHPPTHYFVTAMTMKLLHVAYIPATAVSVFALTLLVIATLYTGRYEFGVATAALIATHTTVYIFANFTTGRPDVHTSIAWIAGLLLMQSAKNRDWSLPRMFFGAAVCTYAGMMHYWGTLSFLAVGVYAIYFLATSSRERWPKGMAALAAGGMVVGLPYLILFVIPQLDYILGVTDAVQGNRGWRDSYDRHLLDYQVFRDVYLPGSWIPDFSVDGLRPRWLVGVLLNPQLRLALGLGIPLFVLAAVLLAVHRQSRVLGIAGLGVPLMVLLNATGKGRDYYLPEIFLALFAVLVILFYGSSLVLRLLEQRVRPSLRGFTTQPVLSVVVALVGIAAVVQVPVSMWQGEWKFTRHMDMVEVNRAAARALVGPKAVHLASIHNWFNSGAQVIWLPPDSQPQLPATSEELKNYLGPADYFIETLGISWHFHPNAWPVNIWYLQDKMNLEGFILNKPYIGQFHQLYFTPGSNQGSPGGFLVGRDTVQRFVPKPGGNSVFEVLLCDRFVAVPSSPAGFFQFPVATDHADAGPHLYIMVDGKEGVANVSRALVKQVPEGFASTMLERAIKQDKKPAGEPTCASYQRVEGDLVDVDRDKLLRDSEATDRTILFTDDRWDAYEQSSLLHGGGTLPKTSVRAISAPPNGLQLEVTDVRESNFVVSVEGRTCQTCAWTLQSSGSEAKLTLPPLAPGAEYCFRVSVRYPQTYRISRPSDPVCATAYKADWQVSSLPQTMTRGQNTSIRASATNSGYIFWQRDTEDFVFFALKWYESGCGGKAILENSAKIPKDVAPEETMGIAVDVQPPAKPGKYCVKLDMAHYGAGYFEDFGAKPYQTEVTVR